MLNQLQELDKQISDLRLDVEKTSEEHLETDSRPSSGGCWSLGPNLALLTAPCVTPDLQMAVSLLLVQRIKKKCSLPFSCMRGKEKQATFFFDNAIDLETPEFEKRKASIQISARAVGSSFET